MALVLQSLPKFKNKVAPLYLRFLSTLYQPGTRMATATRMFPEIVKSSRDLREYRGLELSNKMKVLLISDPTTDISAAALCVAAGSMHDPKELPGLAHFCEHMLFLGTKMFPAENEYSKYLAEHGGYSNAYTAQDHTCYYFDVAPDGLQGALLRFAQFFISPLFTPSMTEREVNAVNSEHEKNIPNDTWRMHQLEVILSNPNHPYHNFATGNRDTLWNIPKEKAIDVRGALLRYYEATYSANMMNLIILGKENLDELQELAEKLFNDVVDRNNELPKWTTNPYGRDEVQQWVKVIPIKDIRHLKITFPIIDTSEDYKCLSDGYLSHLIGHEGPGSLLSLLKRKSYVNNLAAGGTVLSRGNAVFKIDMELTPEGLDHADDVMLHVFQYLSLLNSTGPKDWIWNETVDLQKINFEYQDKIRPQVYVAGLSSELHRVQMPDILSHGIESAEYNPTQIREIMERLTPENCIVIISAKEFENELEPKDKEPYYGIEYTKKKIDEKLIQKWKGCGLHPELKLPEVNSYIPKTLELKPRDTNTGIIPRLLKDEGLSRVWYLQDNEFHLPKGIIRAEIFSPLAYLDAHHVNQNSMFVSAVKDLLTEEVYAAALAGLRFVIQNTNYGLELILKGYDDKIPTLLEIVLDRITNFNLSQERFDVLKDYMVRGLRNWADDQPYSHAFFYLDFLLHNKKISYAERLDKIDGVTLENLKQYVENFMKNLKFEILVCGNFTAEDSKELVNSFEKFFEAKNSQAVPPSEIIRRREVKLPTGTSHVLTTDHRSSVSSCVLVNFQTGLETVRHNVILELIESIANEPCYNQLRTEEQLGYIVASQVRRSNGTQGLNILVQSNFHPSHVDSRIQDFLEKFEVTLKEMPEEQFQTHLTSLIVKKSEKPKKIGERMVRIWSEISSHHYNFDRQAIEVAELGSVTKAEVIEYYQKHIASDGSDRRKLGVHIISKSVTAEQVNAEAAKHMDSAKVLDLKDVGAWKEKLDLYPPVDGAIPPHKAKL